jgi:hypothetical protein
MKLPQMFIFPFKETFLNYFPILTYFLKYSDKLEMLKSFERSTKATNVQQKVTNA